MTFDSSNDSDNFPRDFRMTLPYSATPRGMVWHTERRKKPVEVLLANFDARIVRDVLYDDGSTEHRVFEIQTTMNGQQSKILVPATKFPSLSWVVESLGASAAISAGYGIRDHLRMAIQKLSGDVPVHHVYRHTGWRQTDRHGWVYLHGGGGIGVEGKVQEVTVRLNGTLSNIVLRLPSDREELLNAVQACLRYDQLVPDRLAIPIRAAIARSVLGVVDFSLFVSGPSGAGKTEYAALAQQHFGAGFSATSLPASWSSTDNALEDLAFLAKDALMVIDDFAPTGSSYQVQQLHSKAERVLRAAGNRSGRQRMQSDLSQAPHRPPRGLILSTGEDLPRGYSLNARLLHLPVDPKDMDWAALSTCQRDAAVGLYAMATAGFVEWIAAQYEQISGVLSTEISQLRSEVIATHRRAPTIAANLGVAFRYWVHYLVAIGALEENEGNAHWTRGWEAIRSAVGRQDDHQLVSEPTRQFFELLRIALAGGSAHVEAVAGGVPDNPTVWGWKARTQQGSKDGEYLAQGSRIGWIEGDSLYLDPRTAYPTTVKTGVSVGLPLSISSATLNRRLFEKGLLLQTELKSRSVYTIRKTVASMPGVRPDVLHISADSFLGNDAEDNSDMSANPTNPTGLPTDAPLAGKVGSDNKDDGLDGDGQDAPPSGTEPLP